MNPETISFTRRSLPHWEVADRSYFVTFRLRHSLPENVILNLRTRREQMEKTVKSQDKVLEFQRYEFREIEKILDSVNNSANAFLTKENIAPIIMNAFDYLEKKYCWRFPSYVVMPNHIHCLCVADKEGGSKTLTEIIALLKRYTAREINKILNRKGRVWVDENFDHWCRGAEKEESVKRYIRQNPVKAGLVKNADDWQWKK